MAKKIYKNKRVLVVLSLVAIGALGAAVYVKLSHRNGMPPTDQQQLKKAEEKAPPSNPKTDNEAYRRDQQKQAQGTSNTATANIYISSLTQDGSNVYVGAIVDNQTSGTCTAHFSSGTSAFNLTAPLGVVTNYYACQGFNVPKSSFPHKGPWSVKVDFTNQAASGSTATQQIDVN